MIIDGSYLIEVLPTDLVNGELVIPNNITRIKRDAFLPCINKLKSIKFPDNILNLPTECFDCFYELKSVVLPKNMPKISSSLFRQCHKLEEVIFPEELTTIGESAFQGCNSLKTLNFPERLEEIQRNAFQGCTSLETINFNNNLYEIGSEAFESCTSLKQVDLPKSATRLHDSIFLNCSNLTSITFPSLLTIIPDSMFKNCVKLKDISLPKYTHSIGDGTFENCKLIETLDLPKTLLDVGYYAFNGCDKLDNITLPDSVRIVKLCTFQNCTNLKNIQLAPETVRIEGSAFSGCSSLKSITIPDSVYLIDDKAFYGCENLEQINIPNSVTNIGGNVFENCFELKYLFVPDSVTTMEDNVNNSLLNFTRVSDGFELSFEPNENSIPAQMLNIDLAFLSKYWEYKSTILKDEKNPAVADFYNTFLDTLSDEKIEKFLASHNFTFFKQLNINPAFVNTTYYKFLYNIGALEAPIEVNGKKVDYAQKIVGFLQEKMEKSKLTKANMKEWATTMKIEGFKPEFTEFFMNHYDKILEEVKHSRRFISDCYDDFEKAQMMNTSNRGSQRQLKATVESMKNYFLHIKFNGITEENKHIADKISPYFRHQLNFDDALKIDAERKKRKTPDNILKNPLKEADVMEEITNYAKKVQGLKYTILGNLSTLAENEFTFDWLQKNDPENFILGKLCNCCSHLEGQGFSIMKASIIHPSIQTLVIRDKENVIVAKSTIYVNKSGRYAVCNNVEISHTISNFDKQKIYQKFVLGVRAFALKYNKEHPLRPLKQINVGMNLNDLSDPLKSYRYESINHLDAIDYSIAAGSPGGYTGDSFAEQYVVWSADEEKEIKRAPIPIKQTDNSEFVSEIINSDDITIQTSIAQNQAPAQVANQPEDENEIIQA